MDAPTLPAPLPSPLPADLSADEACRALGIRKATLYAYVSRGLIRSAPTAGASRARRYDAEDVARLARRRSVRRAPDNAGLGALRWGAPVLETRLSSIAAGRYAYRGRDAVHLAATESFERVAALLWAGDLEASDAIWPASTDVPETVGDARPVWSALPVLEAMKVALPLAAADDPGAWQADVAAQRRAGARIVRLLAAIAARTLAPAARVPRPSDVASADAAPASVATALQRAWRPDAPAVAGALDAVLVLCADHELNASSFAARVVTGAGSPLYDAVLAGLAALGGTRHGGHTARVAALLREVDAPARAAAVVADRLRRGDDVPGFGHPLYPEGDPRFPPLFALARAHVAGADGAAVVARAAALIDAVHDLDGRRPTLDVGLVALERALELPDGAALALFAVGRSAGWVAHALEQAAEGTMIRPRARFVGEAVE